MKIKSKTILSLIVLGIITLNSTSIYAINQASERYERMGSIVVGTGVRVDNLLKVTMPTKIGFVALPSGRLITPTMTIENNSDVAIEVSVSNFTQQSNNETSDSVSLLLSGNSGNSDFEKDSSYEEGDLISKISPSSKDSIQFSASLEEAELGLEEVSEEFRVIFKINKVI